MPKSNQSWSIPVDRVEMYARRLRSLREDHDLTQAQVASLLHVARRTYTDYEHGKIRTPADSLMMLAEYYDIDMNYICGITQVTSGYPKA